MPNSVLDLDEPAMSEWEYAVCDERIARRAPGHRPLDRDEVVPAQRGVTTDGRARMTLQAEKRQAA